MIGVVYIAGAVVAYNLLPNGWRKKPATVATYCGLWPVYAVIWGVALALEAVENDL